MTLFAGSIIVSFNKPDEAQSFYKERWQIEVHLKRRDILKLALPN